MDCLLVCTQLPGSSVDPDEVRFGHLLTLVVALFLLVGAHLAMLLVAAL
ncbi:hypothetical protein [Bradyrhizobium sp. NAS96.2]|nr:hypothetical protein [Bradyrhizobium sp. NAS96.2]